MFGQHYIKSWSKTQSLVALSSAESELYALVRCVSELLGIRSALKDWGSNVGGVVKTDASAALGIIQWQGLGKVRHIDIALLHVQNFAAQKTLDFCQSTRHCESCRHVHEGSHPGQNTQVLV